MTQPTNPDPSKAEGPPSLAQIMAHDSEEANPIGDSVVQSFEPVPAPQVGSTETMSVAPTASPKAAARAPAWLLFTALLGGVCGAGAAAALHYALPVAPATAPEVAAKLAAIETRLGTSVPLSALIASDQRLADLDAKLTAGTKAGLTAMSRAQLVSATAGQNAAHIRSLSAALAELKAEVLAQRTALDGKPSPANPAEAVGTALPVAVDLAPLEARLARLESGLATAIAAMAQANPTPPPPAHVDLAPVETRIAQLEAGAAALNNTLTLQSAKAQADEAARRAAAEAAAARDEIAKTQARIAVERSAQAAPGTENAAALAVVAQALLNGLERPSGYALELAAATNLGASPEAVSALQPFADKGLPTFRDLSSAFAEQVEPAPAPAPVGAPVPQGWMDQLLASSTQLVRVTPPPKPGAATNTAATASALAQGDIAGALAAREKLPEALQKATASVAKTANARLAAKQAAQALLTSALAALAAPRPDKSKN